MVMFAAVAVFFQVPPVPPIPDGITDQSLLLIAFMLLLGFAAVALAVTKGPAVLAAWRGAGNTGSIKNETSLVEQLSRIESDIKILKGALITQNDEGHPTATSRRLAADLAGRLDRIESLVKLALKARKTQ